MATASRPITVQEYLGTSYRPDCDLVEGELQERNLGELEHSEMQLAIIQWFLAHADEWGLIPYPEIRIQTGPQRFRVADIAVLPRNAPRERILLTPPLIVIEILSPEDRVARYRERLEDYRAMGIRNIWVVDPMTLEGFDCSSGSWNKTESFHASGSAVEMPIKDLVIRR